MSFRLSLIASSTWLDSRIPRRRRLPLTCLSLNHTGRRRIATWHLIDRSDFNGCVPCKPDLDDVTESHVICHQTTPTYSDVIPVFTARISYASAVLGILILSVRHTRALWRNFDTTWKGNHSSLIKWRSGEIQNFGGVKFWPLAEIKIGDFRPNICVHPPISYARK